MKNLAQKFLSEQEQAQINAAVQAAEKQTSGEIVCMVQSASYHYPMAHVIGATTLGLPLALVLTPLLGGWLWLGTQNMWLFLSCFAILFSLFYLCVRQMPWLKRLFISKKDMDEEVHEAALTNFFQHGLYRTRDATGVLVFISVLERKVWVLADRGIDAKMAPGAWEGIVTTISQGIKSKQAAPSICQAIETIGKMLAENFPIRPDDENELQNLIINDQ
jgi:putative membrane protein